jgi:hypothetical protein
VQGRRLHTRAVSSIDRSVSLNRALWVLAEEMRKLKGLRAALALALVDATEAGRAGGADGRAAAPGTTNPLGHWREGSVLMSFLTSTLK